MKAVNLIPLDERRGAAAAARSGGAVYALLAALATLAVLAATYGLVTRAAHDRARQLADVTARADAADAAAGRLSAYVDFAALRQQRTAAVKTLAGGRTDWAHILREIARTMPSDAWLTSLHGTTGASTGPAPAGAAASPAPAAAAATAAAAPSIELGGCTTSQTAASRLMVDLRSIDGIADVKLNSSAKGATSQASPASGGSGSGSGPCSGPGRATFAMTLAFKAPAPGAPTPTRDATAGSTP
jgi:Tfp pilus assembly protein PilN